MLKKVLSIILIIFIFFSISQPISAEETNSPLTLRKETEQIKTIKIRNKTTNRKESVNFKLIKYSIHNNTEDKYKIVKIKNFMNNDILDIGSKDKEKIISLDTTIYFFFTVWCPLVAPYFAYYLIKDIVLLPKNIYTNIKIEKENEKIEKGIIGKEIRKKSKFTFYKIDDFNNETNAWQIILKNKTTEKFIILSDNTKKS